jgi:hypothetical protein
MLLAAATDPWADFFFGLDEGKRFVLIIIGIGCVTGIVISLAGIISGVITTIHRRRLESEMKRDLIDRGMSPDDIARVIESTQPKDFLERWAVAAQNRGKS